MAVYWLSPVSCSSPQYHTHMEGGPPGGGFYCYCFPNFLGKSKQLPVVSFVSSACYGCIWHPACYSYGSSLISPLYEMKWKPEIPSTAKATHKDLRLLKWSFYFFKVIQPQGRLGGSVGKASDFGSGHDLTVCEFQPCVGLCADSSEPGACFGFCVSLSLSPPMLTLCLSLSLSQK